MEYNDGNRGLFQCEDRSKQLISFEGMKFPGRWGTLTVSPSNIDGFFQLDTKDAFVFFELKYKDKDLPSGQRDGLRAICDAIHDGKHNGILFVSSHDIKDVNEKVLAKDSIVEKYYTCRKWFIKGVDFKEGLPLNYVVNSWLNNLGTQKAICNGNECSDVLSCEINQYIGNADKKIMYMPTIDIIDKPFYCKRDYQKIREYFKQNTLTSESGKRTKDAIGLMDAIKG